MVLSLQKLKLLLNPIAGFGNGEFKGLSWLVRSLQARNSRSFNHPLSPGHHLPPAAVALAPGLRRGAAPQVPARPRAEARCPKRPEMLPDVSAGGAGPPLEEVSPARTLHTGRNRGTRG